MLKVLSLPDETRDWHGTAAQLATQVNELLPLVGLEADAGSANERLVRYYVAEGILTEPESRGRERMFGFTQIIEFLIARQLLKDGWPLAKIRELIRSSAGIEGLLELGSPSRTPTAAERAVASIQEYSVPPSADSSFSGSGARFATRESIHRMASAPTSLGRAAELSHRRSHLRDDLKSLGNPSGRPHRRKVLRLSLTPWCQVQIDVQSLKNMDANTPQVLGDALARVLEEERLMTGEKD